jgi:hypothetical protein
MGEFKVVSLARLSAGRSGIGGAGAVALEAGYREIPTSQSLCQGQSVEIYPDAPCNQLINPTNRSLLVHLVRRGYDTDMPCC